MRSTEGNTNGGVGDNFLSHMQSEKDISRADTHISKTKETKINFNRSKKKKKKTTSTLLYSVSYMAREKFPSKVR